jgi:iron complex outermembrane receptor protein
VGAAYHVDWSNKGVLELGIQKEAYRETASVPGAPQSEISAHPFRAYANAAFAATPKLTFYGGYTQGLEKSGVAPSFAHNSGAVLPASLTWQFDFGARYVVTPKLKLIGGVFELEKPYFNLDASNVDRQLGVQRSRGVEFSVAGEVTPNLNVNIGALAGTVGITGPDLAAEGVGSVAIGQPHVSFVAAANYVLPRWHAASIDLRFLYIGAAPETLDARVETSPASILNIGGRYKFTAFGRNNTLRVQIQNALARNLWQQLSTPGVFQWPGPRRIFAYLTTDL